MSEPQYPQSQNPAQHPNQPTKDSYGGSKPPEPPPSKDPCDDPKPPDPKPTDPKAPETPPCPPNKPCPKPPTRPTWPTDPSPPPAEYGKEPPGGDEPGPYAEAQTEPGDPGQQTNPQGTQPSTGAGAAPTTAEPPGSPADHLAALKTKLENEQKQLQELEPLKTSMADLTQRIAALEKAVDGQAAVASGYKEFYRTTEVALHEITCFIPTVRCQLDTIKDKHKQCIAAAILKIDTRVNKAKSDSAAAVKTVAEFERASTQATLVLDWARKWYEFLKSGLQQQVTKQRDDLKALKLLADPAKDQCQVWFYLYEMERVMKSGRDVKDVNGVACWDPDLSVGTFLDCWPWECYEQAWNWVIVEFNKAEAEEKLVKSRLEQARKRATELDKIAKDAESKRREWILKEIKAMDCCGPASNCP